MSPRVWELLKEGRRRGERREGEGRGGEEKRMEKGVAGRGMKKGEGRMVSPTYASRSASQ